MQSAQRIGNSQLIKLRSDAKSIGVSRSEWQKSLSEATPDPVVSIRHGEIPGGEPSYRKHVAAIPQQVGCHYHAIGDEDYAVVEGQGILFFGQVTDGTVEPNEWKSIEVSTGDSFVIPEGYAHQLRKTGPEALTILFGCPDSHLDNDKDRYLLPDAPLAI